VTSFTVSVIIPAYTLDRWELIKKSVESARAQTVAIDQVVLCVDNNQDLFLRAQGEWGAGDGTPVVVIENRHDEHLAGLATHQKAHGIARRFGAGTARNSAAEVVTSDILAFLDDDAWAERDWVEQLLLVYGDANVVAVGGAPMPDYETGRPAWFPANFDWVFGCAYAGLPVRTAPLRHLIGANMSVRREALVAVGGFHSVDFDDLDLCMRIAERYGTESVYYNPAAIVHHYVSSDRVTWRYFRRRCFFVNREKVHAFREMGAAANLHAEREFVLRSVRVQTVILLRSALARKPGAMRALMAMFAGIALAAWGNLRGRLDAVLSA
jgi:cellulose synthase/poly-beta-1,6-N-acetylglucosamine synthase-like glycosyltransferase